MHFSDKFRQHNSKNQTLFKSLCLKKVEMWFGIKCMTFGGHTSPFIPNYQLYGISNMYEWKDQIIGWFNLYLLMDILGRSFYKPLE